MTMYALRPVPGTGSLDNAEVVNQSPSGWQFLTQAIALWRLVDGARAAQLDAIKQRLVAAAGGDELRIDPADQRELARLVGSIDAALVAAGIIDDHWRVAPERLEELARQVPAMDLTTERSMGDKTCALGEVVVNVISVRNFLENAAKAGCVVVLA